MNTKTLQSNLIQLGYGELLRPFGADGKIGTKTRNTVKAFQKDFKNIKVNGIPEPQTYNAINHAKNQAGIKGTKNFKIREFACKGSGSLPSGGMDKNLLLKLEQLRYNLGGHALIINSGYRTPAHNKKVGGASNSQHLYGKAADIVVRGVKPSKVYSVADKLYNGVGKYNTCTHVDTRSWWVRF